jgi:hypothetical protein
MQDENDELLSNILSFQTTKNRQKEYLLYLFHTIKNI